MEFERGELLKLSDKGLTHLYGFASPAMRNKAKQRRFEYRCKTRASIDCLTVLRLPKRWYEVYHKSFLERV